MKIVKWFDPIGQLILLLAAAYQLFVVFPAISNHNTSQYEELILGIARLESPTKASDPYYSEVFRAKINATSRVDHWASVSSDRSLYAGLAFLFGGVLTFFGKAITVYRTRDS